MVISWAKLKYSPYAVEADERLPVGRAPKILQLGAKKCNIARLVRDVQPCLDKCQICLSTLLTAGQPSSQFNRTFQEAEGIAADLEAQLILENCVIERACKYIQKEVDFSFITCTQHRELFKKAFSKSVCQQYVYATID